MCVHIVVSSCVCGCYYGSMEEQVQILLASRWRRPVRSWQLGVNCQPRAVLLPAGSACGVQVCTTALACRLMSDSHDTSTVQYCMYSLHYKGTCSSPTATAERRVPDRASLSLPPPQSVPNTHEQAGRLAGRLAILAGHEKCPSAAKKFVLGRSVVVASGIHSSVKA
ncbi:hypothetical protein K504DRAFT_14436 [Pleomassaria siparia CBS 279.74]|uniref:Uncharacterized protein n=1 Tax=Pleomassaria siparia CBS 279.74 TaxID=1314801 RepID=A0A6G1KPV1_9PLEO|nr:hypothetical protein K504DRAFT_14436 [Pleomassaria siparia CBS 279.74]